MTILVVEDDSFIRDTLCDVLSDAGYCAVGTAEGGEALQYLREHNDVDLVLLDLMMPGVDGYAFRKEQLTDERFSRIPVIVFTAQDMHPAGEFEATHMLRKPAELTSLLHIIEAVKAAPSQVPCYAQFH